MKENEKIDKYLDLARELKKNMEHESDGDSNCNWGTQHSVQRIDTGTEGLENKTSWDHSNYWPEYQEEPWKLEETWCR